MKNLKAKELSFLALAVVLLCVCSWLSIPVPFSAVVYSMQTLGVCLIGGLLGAKRGLIAVTVWILLGAIGVPVFSAFTAGLTHLSSGFVLGCLPYVVFSGLALDDGLSAKQSIYSKILPIVFLTVGLLLWYLVGTVWAMVYMRWNFLTALFYCVIPFFFWDIIKTVLSVWLVKRIKPILISISS